MVEIKDKTQRFNHNIYDFNTAICWCCGAEVKGNSDVEYCSNCIKEGLNK